MGIAEDLEELYRQKDEAEKQRLEIEEQIKLKKAEEMKQKLLDFEKTLSEIDRARDDKMNVFSAVGLDSQEVRHSSFLSWLFDAEKPHGLGNAFLKKFCEKLYEYKTGKSDKTVVSNKAIIDERGLYSRLDIMLANPYKVGTERVVINDESRIDVFIESDAAQTVIVIENKVFTGVHGDQLNRYEDELKAHDEYRNYNKIHVFLTPRGELPTDKDGDYDSDWCVFDYAEIKKIIKQLHAKLSKSQKDARIKILLEDYMDVLEKNILRENKDLRALCKQILREHKDALEYLNEYEDNGEELLRYARERLNENYPNIEIYYIRNRAFCFYTKATKEYLTLRGIDLFESGGNMRCNGGIWVDANGMFWNFCLNKSRDEKWDDAIVKIMEKVAPKKKRGDKYFRFITVKMLDADECVQPLEKITPVIDKSISNLASELKKFDEMLLNI